MRKLILALLVGGMVAAAVAASAAGLTVNTKKLGSGDVTVASCNSTAVAANWTAAYDATLGYYEVATITVTGVDGTNCNTAGIQVQLTTAANATIGPEYTGTIVTADTSKAWNTTADNIRAENVTGAHVVIIGP